MKKDLTYAPSRFNCYLTVRQKALLETISKERRCPKTELLREAVHFWLRGRGVEDGLIYDEEDFFKEYERGKKAPKTSGISSA